MGTPKQLRPWGNTIILQQVVDNAAASNLERVVLVLGDQPFIGLAIINRVLGEYQLTYCLSRTVAKDYGAFRPTAQ